MKKICKPAGRSLRVAKKYKLVLSMTLTGRKHNMQQVMSIATLRPILNRACVFWQKLLVDNTCLAFHITRMIITYDIETTSKVIRKTEETIITYTSSDNQYVAVQMIGGNSQKAAIHHETRIVSRYCSLSHSFINVRHLQNEEKFVIKMLQKSIFMYNGISLKRTNISVRFIRNLLNSEYLLLVDFFHVNF